MLRARKPVTPGKSDNVIAAVPRSRRAAASPLERSTLQPLSFALGLDDHALEERRGMSLTADSVLLRSGRGPGEQTVFSGLPQFGDADLSGAT